MRTVCWSVKGGSGVTVVTAMLAILSARHEPTLAVDLGGHLPAALGADEPLGAGVSEWLDSSPDAGHRLADLATSVDGGLGVVHRGRVPLARLDLDGWVRLLDAGSDAARSVLVDAGPCLPPDPAIAGIDLSLLVLRPCYLALRAAAGAGERAHGVVLVDEPGRALRTADVARAVGLPVVARIPLDPAVARAVDAGLLASRVPHAVARAMRRIAAPVAR